MRIPAPGPDTLPSAKRSGSDSLCFKKRKESCDFAITLSLLLLVALCFPEKVSENLVSRKERHQLREARACSRVNRWHRSVESQPGNENQLQPIFTVVAPALQVAFQGLLWPLGWCRLPASSLTPGRLGLPGPWAPDLGFFSHPRLVQPPLKHRACPRPRMNLDLRQCLGNMIPGSLLPSPSLGAFHGFPRLVPRSLPCF